jgi:putative transposase
MSKACCVDSAGDERWARFRFGVIGPLLAAPAATGELQEALTQLAAKQWKHPKTGQWVQFGRSTIERWYYRALSNPNDPVGVLSRKIRGDNGTHPSMNDPLRVALQEQYRQHPDWSYQLHADNLAVWVQQHPASGPMPGYVTLRRYMTRSGFHKRRRLGGGRDTAGARAANWRFENLEIRSYESEYNNALWHLDFHSGSLKILLSSGTWVHPQLFGMLDDHSRLCCHAQWYLSEAAEMLVHGTCQSLEKRGMPRAIMSDNGGAMVSDEFTGGLARLGIVHEKTLPYSPYQNGKQEVFWAQVEGRLLAMLSGCENLTLPMLNDATQAWVEMEYNRKVHTELGKKPVERYIEGKDVGRTCPSSEALRLAFTAPVQRVQRRSDGTVSIEGVRFELPSRYRHLTRLCFRYASWDLSQVYLADERTGQILCRVCPQDKQNNADARRRRKEPVAGQPGPVVQPGGMAPLLKKLIADYAATGLPPAYCPKNEDNEERMTSHE